MDHNPYSPPKASVADAPDPVPARPKEVATAIWSMLAALVVSPLVSIHQAVYTSSGIGVVAGLVTLALIYAIVAPIAFWVLRSLAKGRRWSRVVVSIVALLQVSSLAHAAVVGIPQYAAPVRFLEGMLLAAVVVLLFTPAANRWFRRE